jgi:hypothetical protein
VASAGRRARPRRGAGRSGGGRGLPDPPPRVGSTSLFGVDLFPDALAKLLAIQPSPAGHPFFFYLRLGYEPVGLLPDANGFGKPDILMAKRIAKRTSA